MDHACADARRFCADRALPLVELDRRSTESPWYWLTLARRVRRKRRVLPALTAERLTASVINKYLELKGRAVL